MPGRVHVAPAGPADDGVLARLRRAWAAEAGGGVAADAGYEERFRAWLGDEGRRRRFWLARHDGRPVGMVNLLTVERMPMPGRPGGRWGHLGNLFVLPGHRRAGVATMLVDTVLAGAAAQGLERVVVHPNEASLAFWRSTRFVTTTDLLVREMV